MEQHPTAKDYEVDLALKHLEHTRENDLLICDRNYLRGAAPPPSYRWLSNIEKMGRKYIVCGVLLHPSESSYKKAREMLKGIGEDSQLTTIKPSYKKNE